jgi:hypothetical protein
VIKAVSGAVVLAAVLASVPFNLRQIIIRNSGHSTALPQDIPDFCDIPNFTAISTGNWSSGATWNTGTVPVSNSKVVVNPGVTVTYDVNASTTPLKCVGVRGTLYWPRNTTTGLRVSELMVYPGGTLDMGTSGSPVLGATDIVFDGTLNISTDPQAHGVGFIGLGRVLIHGRELTPVTRLTAGVSNGASSVTASDVTGWQAGDEILLPDTREVPGNRDMPWTPQTLTIQSISAPTVTFTGTTSHAYPTRRDGTGTVEGYPPVGNLTRNIVFRSANPSGVRGHIILTGQSTGRLNFFRVEDMGRTLHDQDTTNGSGANPIGRYALHFHQLGNTDYTSDGMVIVRSKKWGLTVHDTNLTTISRPVIYEADGWGAGFEDGGETDNILENGLVVAVDGDASEQGSDHKNVGEWGRNGVCVWMQSPTNIVRGMIGANCRVSGFSLWDTLDNDDSGPLRLMPDGYFEDNEAISNWAGLQYFNIGHGNLDTSYVTRFTEWHSSKFGFYWYPSGSLLVQDMITRGDPTVSPKDETMYSWFGDYDQADVIFDNFRVSGKSVGLWLPYGSAPPNMSANSTGRITVRNSDFNKNEVDIRFFVTSTSQSDKCAQRAYLIELHNNLHGALSTLHILSTHDGNGSVSLDHELTVYNFNRKIGDNFHVYALQQDGGQSIAQTSTGSVCGCTSAGMTNQQCFDAHGQATFGEVTPGDATTRSKITNKIKAF